MTPIVLHTILDLIFSGNKAEKIANILGIPFFFEYCFLRNGYFEIEKNKQYLSHGIIGHYKIDQDTEIEVSIRGDGYPSLNFSCKRNYIGKNGEKSACGCGNIVSALSIDRAIDKESLMTEAMKRVVLYCDRYIEKELENEVNENTRN